MPRRKCDTDVTDAPARPPREGSGTRRATPKRTPVPEPEWPRAGDLVELMWTDARLVRGLVLEARPHGWNPPTISVLTDAGERVIWKSPNVRIIARRRRKPKARRAGRSR